MRVVATSGKALQDIWPEATCYGCGPANADGLHIKSYWSEDGSAVVATFQPQAKFNAGFDNVMYGGLVASLMDCHSIWAAIAHGYQVENRPYGSFPTVTYVTGRLDVRFLKTTPLDQPILLRAVVQEAEGRKTKVFCQLGIEGLVTAEANVLAVRTDADKSIGSSTP